MKRKIVILEMNMWDEEEREIFQAGIPYEVKKGKIENEDNLKISLDDIWVGYEVKLTKDVEWNIDGKQYVVKNVPYSELQAEESDYFDSDVSIRLTMLRDLMYMNNIPSEIDYNIVLNFEV